MPKIVKTKQKEPEKSFHEKLQAELAEDRDKGKPGSTHYGYATGEDVIKFPEKISTGSLLFDLALEGGYRCGWSRFSGDPELGKTSQGLVWAGNWQRKFGDDAFIVAFNAEGRITADLVRRSGIDPDEKRFIRIDSHVGDYVVDKMAKMINVNPEGKRFFFIVDSSDALNREHDLDKGAGQAEKIGGGATLLSFTGKRLSLPVSVMGHHLYITSQLRDKMSAMASGKGESGGNAPKFYSSISGRMKKYWVKGTEDGNIYDAKEEIIGRKTLCELYKSPNEAKREVLLHIKNKHIGGIWLEYELFFILLTYGMIEKSGSWFAPSEAFGEDLVKEKVIDEPFAIQGELKLVQYLEANPKLVSFLTELVKTNLIKS